MTMTNEWDDAAKAQWILENGAPNFIMKMKEHAGGLFFEVPMGRNIPPWAYVDYGDWSHLNKQENL